MVLLAAAVCTHAGKAILSRQFVEMTRIRIEALLAAFPYLMTIGKQHTFVETDSIRYVYQPLGELLYMVLLTTKNSNILEDLETLRLFSQVIPKYCPVLEKSEISEHCFDLIFAFDEIVALGYREDVTPTQILTFTQMYSREEEEFRTKRRIQEREARAKGIKKARELQQARREAERSGNKMQAFSRTSSTPGSIIADTIVNPRTPKMAPIRPSSGTSSSRPKALKLHSRGKEVEDFVDKLKSEGETIIPAFVMRRGGSDTTTKTNVLLPSGDDECVQLCVKETMSLTCSRDGGLLNMEVLGKVTAQVTENNNRICLIINNNDKKGFELKTHPNIDKKLFTDESVIGLKNPENSFPLNQDVLLLKWRLQTTDKSLIPLTITCWPSEGVSGCDVIMEYELQEESLELNNVVISIPVPTGVAPVISDFDGECEHDRKQNLLMWRLPIIDANNMSGCLEFNINGQPDNFFPVNVSFVSKRNYCNVQVTKVIHVDGDTPVRFSSETSFVVDKYQIL